MRFHDADASDGGSPTRHSCGRSAAGGLQKVTLGNRHPGRRTSRRRRRSPHPLLPVLVGLAFAFLCLLADRASGDDGDGSLAVTVRNSCRFETEVYWVSDDGDNEVLMYELKPGDEARLNTYAGHAFAWVTQPPDNDNDNDDDHDEQLPAERIEMLIPSYAKSGDAFELSEDLQRGGRLSVVRKKQKSSEDDNEKWRVHQRKGQSMVRNSEDSSAVIKFTNHRSTSVDIFWDDGRDGAPQGSVGPNRTKCQSSYVGHKFFFTEPGSSRRLSTVTASVEEPEKLILPPVVTPELRDFIDKGKMFRDEYYERTGVHWLAEIDRPPPRWHQWEAREVGQRHVVTTNNTLFDRIPKKDTDRNRSRRRDTDIDDEDEDEEAKQCRAEGEETTFTLEVLSTHPKVFRINNFLSDAEVDHIIEIGERRLARSTTAGRQSGTRTSQTAWVGRTDSSVVDAIHRRVADLVRIPERHLHKTRASEEIQLVHYDPGQMYSPHHDWQVSDGWPTRYLTLLFYLTDQEGGPDVGGGQTAFPKAEGGAIAVHPGKGNAILFYNVLGDGNVDDRSLHTALPVNKGEKWLANVWIWDPAR